MFTCWKHQRGAPARILQIRQSSSTVSQHARPQARFRIPRPVVGCFAIIALSAGLGLVYHDHHQRNRNTLRADSNSTHDEDASREVIVLYAASTTDKPLAPPAREGFSITLPSIPVWSEIKEKITDIVIPGWAKVVPGYYKKLQTELSAAPGSLADEIWQEAHNPDINPEIVRYAEVRVSSELCDEERAFLERRKRHVRKALAQYLGVPETEVHPDDVPTIAMCGSGGGLRALVAGTSSYLSAQEAGLFDCTTYTAGVSGSCWLQSLYYSSIAGQSHSKLIDHLKQRLDTHIAFPPPLLNLLTTTPTSKYLLSGGYEKFKGVKDADFGLVDVYGLMLGARLLVPGNELSIDNMDLKISNQQRFIAEGQLPLPIYTAVRHEITREELKANADHGESAAEEAGIESFEEKQDSKQKPLGRHIGQISSGLNGRPMSSSARTLGLAFQPGVSGAISQMEKQYGAKMACVCPS